MSASTTDLEPSQRPLAVTLSPSGGRAADGVHTLLLPEERVDAVFSGEDHDRAYDAYTDFDRLRRGDGGGDGDGGVSVADYVAEFERRYERMRGFDLLLSDAALALKLLDAAALDAGATRRALGACETLTFAAMRSSLRRLGADDEVSACGDGGPGDAAHGGGDGATARLPAPAHPQPEGGGGAGGGGAGAAIFHNSALVRTASKNLFLVPSIGQQSMVPTPQPALKVVQAASAPPQTLNVVQAATLPLQTLTVVQAASAPQQTMKVVQAASVPQQALKVVQATSAILPQVPRRQTQTQLRDIQIAQQALKVVQAASATLPLIPQRQASTPSLPSARHQTLFRLRKRSKNHLGGARMKRMLTKMALAGGPPTEAVASDHTITINGVHVPGIPITITAGRQGGGLQGGGLQLAATQAPPRKKRVTCMLSKRKHICHFPGC
ncbi:hypothetical protein CRUP_001071, partial [Coryphaenoides rupestris]